MITGYSIIAGLHQALDAESVDYPAQLSDQVAIRKRFAREPGDTPPFDRHVGVFLTGEKLVDSCLQLVRESRAFQPHTDMVDNELDAVELADVVSQGRVFTSGVNHHRDAMLAGRGQDPLVSALTHNFEIETGSDADTVRPGALRTWAIRSSISGSLGSKRAI